MCPVTSKVKGYPFEVALPESCLVDGVVLSDQIKSLDWRAWEIESIEFLENLEHSYKFTITTIRFLYRLCMNGSAFNRFDNHGQIEPREAHTGIYAVSETTSGEYNLEDSSFQSISHINLA